MRHAPVIAAVLMLAASSGFGQETLKLHQRQMKPGQYVMTMQQKMTNTTTVQGQQIEQPVDMLMVMQMDVKDPSSAGQKMDIIFKRLKMDVGGMMPMSYDSADPNTASSPLGAGFKHMIDQTLTVTFGPDGNVQEVTGMDEVWEKMVAENPMAAGMKDAFGEKMLRNMFEQNQKMMPTKPVSAGESWQSDITMEVPILGEMTLKQDNTLKEIKSTPQGKVGVIAYEGKMSTSADAASKPSFEGVTVEKADIKHSGTMTFNDDWGMVSSSAGEYQNDMTMTAPGGPGTMNMKQTGTVKTEVKEGTYTPPPARGGVAG